MSPTEQRLTAELERARQITRSLLAYIGEEGKCRGCHALILWVRHANGKIAPYDPDGVNHFATCTKAERFKTKKEA